MNSTSLRSQSRFPTVLESISWENTGAPPISKPQVEAWCKIETDEEEDLIIALIDEVIDLVENQYSFTIREKTVTASWSSYHDKIILPMAPVKSVESVKTVIRAEEEELEENKDYYVNGNAINFTNPRRGFLTIVYKSGWKTVPSGIILGLKKAIMSAHEDRQDVAAMGVQLIPGNSRQIFKRYRRF